MTRDDLSCINPIDARTVRKHEYHATLPHIHTYICTMLVLMLSHEKHKHGEDFINMRLLAMDEDAAHLAYIHTLSS